MTATLTTATPSTERPLRRILLADAGVGLAVAMAMLLATRLYTELTGLPAQVLMSAAVILVGYVLAFSAAALLRPLQRWLVVACIVANGAWVAASLVVLITVPVTPLGAVYVGGQALIVVAFGVSEFVTLRRVQD